eukprot:scaffold14402_cov30-Tisochrysis_lutea.AAC.2
MSRPRNSGCTIVSATEVRLEDRCQDVEHHAGEEDAEDRTVAARRYGKPEVDANWRVMLGEAKAEATQPPRLRKELRVGVDGQHGHQLEGPLEHAAAERRDEAEAPAARARSKVGRLVCVGDLIRRRPLERLDSLFVGGSRGPLYEEAEELEQHHGYSEH